MKPITQFSPATLRPLSTELNYLLTAFAEKHGLSTSNGNFRYTSLDASIKINFTPTATSERVNELLGIAGYPKAGTEFMIKGMSYTVSNIVSNRPKYPVSAVSALGKRIKCSINMVQNNLKK